MDPYVDTNSKANLTNNLQVEEYDKILNKHDFIKSEININSMELLRLKYGDNTRRQNSKKYIYKNEVDDKRA